MSGTTEYIQNLEKELVAATNCERIQYFIDQHVQTVTNLIASQAESLANIASQWAPLLSLPSDPLKILTWAAKVVGGPIAAQIAMMAQLAIEMAQTAAALASLANAAAQAAQRLAACLEIGLLSALDDIQNELLEGAGTLLAQAEAIKDQILVDTGAQDVLDAIDGVSEDIAAISGAADSIENSYNSLPSLPAI